MKTTSFVFAACLYVGVIACCQKTASVDRTEKNPTHNRVLLKKVVLDHLAELWENTPDFDRGEKE